MTESDLRLLTVEGPVKAEIMVLVMGGSGPALTGPCGAEPWYVEVAQGADPMQVVARLVRANLGEPVLVHSTSWRQSRGGVVLTFVAVMDADTVATLERAPVLRADLVRGGATSAAQGIGVAPVIEHGLRHLAWLVKDDPVVAATLPVEWHELLRDYVPEPFRVL